jgi:thymidylate synthase (FAD)
LINLAAVITQKRLDNSENISMPEHGAAKLCKYLVSANHTSLLEHAVITLMIQNVSRSFLAQITRHRMSSFTAASQHYQEYSGYDDIVDEQLTRIPLVKNTLRTVDLAYKDLINHYDVAPEEARQILTNSKAVNILWTVNARSLINFLNLRLCKRNTKEMLRFARAVHGLAKNWFPEVFNHVGPDCVMLNFCRQGHMQAKECAGVRLNPCI